MHQLVWSPLQEGIERLHASGLAASDTDFSISVLQIAESVCETMVKATFRGAYQGLEQSLEHGCLKMEFMPERVKDFAAKHALERACINKPALAELEVMTTAWRASGMTLGCHRRQLRCRAPADTWSGRAAGSP